MFTLQTLANLAEIVGVLIVVGGLFFALLQMRQTRQQRRELAAIELFRFFGNPEFNRAYETVLKLPDGLTTAEIEARSPGMEHCAMLICTTMENIGVMTHQRIVPYAVVKNLMGASTIILWRKLAEWVYALREETGSSQRSSGSSGWPNVSKSWEQMTKILPLLPIRTGSPNEFPKRSSSPRRG